MRRTLKLFVIPAGKPAGAPPEPGPDVELEAASDDALLASAHEAVTTPDAIHAADERLQTILKAHVVGATVQDPTIPVFQRYYTWGTANWEQCVAGRSDPTSFDTRGRGAGTSTG